MKKSIKSVKHIVTESYNYIVKRITEFEDGTKMIQVAHVTDSLTPEMMDSTSFDWIDSPETSTYWQSPILEQDTVEQFLKDEPKFNKISGVSINDFRKNRNDSDEIMANHTVDSFGDKTINVSEGFYNWLIDVAKNYAGDWEHGDDAQIKVIEKMLNK